MSSQDGLTWERVSRLGAVAGGLGGWVRGSEEGLGEHGGRNPKNSPGPEDRGRGKGGGDSGVEPRLVMGGLTLTETVNYSVTHLRFSEELSQGKNLTKYGSVPGANCKRAFAHFSEDNGLVCPLKRP